MQYTDYAFRYGRGITYHRNHTNRDMKTTKQNTFRRGKTNWHEHVQILLWILAGFALIITLSKAIKADKGLGLVGKEVTR